MNVILPAARAWPDCPREFYAFFQQITGGVNGSVLPGDITDIRRRLTALEAADAGGGGTIIGSASVETQGLLPGYVYITLQGDTDAPGATQYYGSDGSGVRGWFNISDAFTSTTDVILAVDTSGITTIGLSDAVITSGGTLKKRAFDAKGRLSQEASATTDDLSEGSNLYFTNARVLATTLTGLSTGASAPVSATDSVLVGIGKLQAQVNTNATAIASKEPAIASGTTSQYWRGDKSWRDFATDVRAAVLTGLSTATSSAIAVTDTVLQAFGKLQAQITDNLLPKGYIDGLQLQWVSGTALTVSSGSAYIEGSSKILRATSAIAKTGLSLTASTWYHVYLYNNAGTPDVELSTTAPAAPYNGTARSKTSDTSRRYVGSVRVDASGNIIRFDHSLANGSVYYLTNINNPPLHPLHLGAATTSTVVDLSAAIPPTSRRAIVYAENSTTGGAGGSIAFISAPPLDPIADVITFLRATSYVPGTYLTDSLQRINYAYNGATTAGTGLDIWVLGYEYER